SRTSRARGCCKCSSRAASATWSSRTFRDTTAPMRPPATPPGAPWRSGGPAPASPSAPNPMPSSRSSSSPTVRSPRAKPGSWPCSRYRDPEMIPRYSRPEMVALWTPERRYQTWLQVEIAAGRAMAQAGLVPADAIEECAKKGGSFTAADAARIDEIEKTTRHDVIAFLTFLEERIGPAARHLHFGMT